MAESKLAGPIKLLQRVQCSACLQYDKPWSHSDIKSSCCQSAHVFTSRYDSTLLHIFYTEGVFAGDIITFVRM